MASECPNCRASIPWTRTFFTTAWGRWRCRGCGALLGVNVRRRFLAVGLWLAIFLLMMGLKVPFILNPPAALALMLVVFVPFFLFFERPVVHERAGFRCRQCGYDLQGQVDPRCPECGREFDSVEIARMQGVKLDSGAGQPWRTRRWVKVVAVLLMVALTAALFVGVLVSRTWRATPGGLPETRAVLDAFLTFAEKHGGRGPRHAIQLTLEDTLPVGVFVTADSMTVAEAVPLADTTLARFEELSPERKEVVVQSAGEALPEPIIAHRLGDFVFTYHGIDLASADSHLWLVIWSPDPGQNPPPNPREKMPVGLADGKIVCVPVASFLQALSVQNVLREGQGLPPLTSPFTLKHAVLVKGKP